ncbi:hypothetical protein BST96_15235 [Oceanicoccus sagamiensis]|uniref:GCVT N-terminal domain-containing protein n=1 Tax=Oceanicoccus sagamiensis TaxID=716816 RepID=A0A1X9NEH3_9GAMM|nr:hypothetical protein BST96_15235 [Oceanicoccus sagamiensis]
MAPLSHYGFLAITGPDTAKFLQGQTTCDVTKVDDQLSCAGAYTTPKGRIVSSFQLARTDAESYLLRMRADIVDSTQAVFAKYIVFSKAEQENVSDTYIALGLYGEQAKAAVSAAFQRCPSQAGESVNQQGNLAIQIDQDGKLYECWVKAADIASFWPLLSEKLIPQSSQHWELQLIQRGLGEVSANTVDSFIPQMLNYQLTGAVSFTKGCYTGQEVVARMEYKGKLKRPMYRIKVAAIELEAGTDLYSTEGEQSIGNIVNSVTIDDQHSEALAVITSKAVDQGTVVVGTDKATIEVLSLPYAITN